MQTGPAPNQSMEMWLLWTGLVELLNVAVFSAFWWILNRALPGEADILSLLGLLTLDVFLLEGGVYWLLVRARFFQRTPARLRVGLLRALYLVNGAFLLVFPGGILAQVARGAGLELADVALGAGFYLFGAGEFVHYFLFKINMRARERRDAQRNRRLVPARLLREIRRARAEARR